MLGTPQTKPTERMEGGKGGKERWSRSAENIEHVIQLVIRDVHDHHLVILSLNDVLYKGKPLLLVWDYLMIFDLVCIFRDKINYSCFITFQKNIPQVGTSCRSRIMKDGI